MNAPTSLPRGADRRPRIHLWPSATGWRTSIGVNGRLGLIYPSSGRAIEQRLGDVDASNGAVIIIEPVGALP